MKHSITFYPVGSGDTSLIIANEDSDSPFVMLVDYCRRPREGFPDIAEKLKSKLDELGREDVDVLVVTHLDSDHVSGIEEFIKLRWMNNGTSSGNFHARELWIPAAALLEEGLEGSARRIRQEARYRLRHENGWGLKVFSESDALKEFFDGDENKGRPRTPDEVRDRVVVHAGREVSHTAMINAGLRVFTHSPFAHVQDVEGETVRNRDAIAFQARFHVGPGVSPVHAMFYSDLKHEDLVHVRLVTQSHDNNERLQYDILKTPHHSSYLSLWPNRESITTDEEPGHYTVDDDIEFLFEASASSRPIIISSSCASAENNGSNPPHEEALSYFKQVADAKYGQFIITDAHPSETHHTPLVVNINNSGVLVERTSTSHARRTSQTPFRAG